MPNYNVDLKERRQILVKKTTPPAAPFDGAKYLCKKFVGEDEVNYECYKKEDFDKIKAGEVLDFDAELRLYGKDGAFPHWYVTKIYSEESQTESSTPIPAKTEIAPQERGMWFKEMGEMLRAKDPDALPLRQFYYAEMMRVLGLKRPPTELPSKSSPAPQESKGLAPEKTETPTVEQVLAHMTILNKRGMPVSKMVSILKNIGYSMEEGEKGAGSVVRRLPLDKLAEFDNLISKAVA